MLQETVLDPLVQLASDPIPNIRFNVAKALETVAVSLGESPEGVQLVQHKVAPVLEALKNDPDADVRYFASKGLQKAHALEA